MGEDLRGVGHLVEHVQILKHIFGAMKSYKRAAETAECFFASVNCDVHEGNSLRPLQKAHFYSSTGEAVILATGNDAVRGMAIRPIDNLLTSDKIYYVNFMNKRENKGLRTTARSFSGILVEQFPHRRHHVNVLVGHPAQALGQ